MWNRPLPQGALKRWIQTKRRFRERRTPYAHMRAHVFLQGDNAISASVNSSSQDRRYFFYLILTLRLVCFACMCFHFYPQTHRYNNEKCKPHNTNMLKNQSTSNIILIKQQQKKSIKKKWWKKITIVFDCFFDGIFSIIFDWFFPSPRW